MMRPAGRLEGALRGLCIGLLIGLSSCSGTSSGQPSAGGAAGGKKSPAVPVTVGTAAKKTVPVQLSAIGNVQAFSTVTVKAQVEGTLTEIHFTEGQHVSKGDLLFTIDPRPFEVQLKQAEAALARDRAQAKLARQEAERYEGLAVKEYVSREQAEQMRAASDAADATLQVDQAVVDNARLQLDYCSIHSPLDGVAGALLVHAGNLVKANDADHPLVVLQQVSPIYAAFSVPASQLPDIKRYMAQGSLKVAAVASANGASVNSPGANSPGTNGPAAAGTLTFVDNTIDLTTGTIQLKALFPNGNKALWPGQFVTVILTLTTHPDAVVVPSSAVQTGQHGAYIFVVKPDLSTESRPVVVGATLNGEQVVEQGIAPGEQVVTDGQSRLVPGATVEIKTGPAADGGRS